MIKHHSDDGNTRIISRTSGIVYFQTFSFEGARVTPGTFTGEKDNGINLIFSDDKLTDRGDIYWRTLPVVEAIT